MSKQLVMSNPYMKFQNPSMQDSKDMLCIKKLNARTNEPEAICPSNFFEVWGIIIIKGLALK